ncbi:hypothetical protein JD844_018136 [Phrynosoma platyrhinos]|uniref:Ig-like domain-containing protein n=1 Tax=Phrynosoma platyrhinos TaxID=52577 RepID=A0ABQ7SMX2_PHRPL|nr:hypothetical protein JD844_018136 [Phrynosoma platyrhinos]
MYFLAENQIPSGFPTIDMGPQLKVVEKARTATMLCAASGNPDPEISWFKDFLPVDTAASNGRIKQLRSGGTPIRGETQAERSDGKSRDSNFSFCSHSAVFSGKRKWIQTLTSKQGPCKLRTVRSRTRENMNVLPRTVQGPVIQLQPTFMCEVKFEKASLHPFLPSFHGHCLSNDPWGIGRSGYLKDTL